ncbi:MAG: CPBP family intramembrane metalloprotease [Prolixibacteraceae bacterium]|nr:CPBP family intramembrane metalloprotease [Prolixibacteraceae bacterium]
MKKRFPSNIIQSILLLFIGLAFTTLLFSFKEQLLKESSKEIYEIVVGSVFGVIGFLLALLINIRNGFSLSFSCHIAVNRDLLIILLTVISYQLVISPIINFLSIYFSPNHTAVINIGFIYYLGAILIGPIVEELMFRGIILNGMLDNYKNSRKAIILSALIFGLIHVKIIQVIPALFWGLVFGYFFYRTKSILLCILLHVTANASGLASDIFNHDNLNSSLLSIYNEYSLTIYSISTIVFILCGFYLFGTQKNLKKYLQCYD